MLQCDRLHKVCLGLALFSTMLVCLGVFYPHWWKQAPRKWSANATILFHDLWSDVRCQTDRQMCFLKQNTVHFVATSVPGWLIAVKIFLVISMAQIAASVLLQVINMVIAERRRFLQVASSSILGGASVTVMIAGLITILQVSNISQAYLSRDFHEKAMALQPAPAGFLLICGIPCCVGALLGFVALENPKPKVYGKLTDHLIDNGFPTKRHSVEHAKMPALATSQVDGTVRSTFG